MTLITQGILDDSISLGSIGLEKDHLERAGIPFQEVSNHGFAMQVGELEVKGVFFYLLWSKDRVGRGCEIRVGDKNMDIDECLEVLLGHLKQDKSFIAYKRPRKDWEREVRGRFGEV